MRWLKLTLVLLVLSHAALAQSAHYEGMSPKDPGATAEAGIVSYNLTRHGEMNSIELYGVDGLLASCEVLLNKTQEATCTVPERGDFRLRFTPDEGVEFEELSTGESLRYVFEKVEEDAQRATAPDTETRFSTPGFSIEVGGSLTQKAAEERWGDVVPLLQFAISEVQLAIMEEQESRARDQERSREPVSQDIDLCGAGEETCSSTIGGFAANLLGPTQHSCCTAASGLADNLCYQATGRSCCANTLCSSLKILLIWSCGLDGFPWTCEPRCEGYITHPTTSAIPQH